MKPSATLVLTVGELRRALAELADSAIVAIAPPAGATSETVRTVSVEVRHGALLLVPSDEDTSALFEAVAAGDIAGARALLSKGVDVNARDPRSPLYDGATALATAAERGLVDMLRLLLELGAEVNARSVSGWTALMRACNSGQTDAARCLLDAGADPDMRNDEGYTAYGRIPGTCLDLMRLFKDRGAA
jgi:ankyrin repeat protein